MRRRDFVALLACAAPGGPLGSAQQPTIPVIEFLRAFAAAGDLTSYHRGFGCAWWEAISQRPSSFSSTLVTM